MAQGDRRLRLVHPAREDAESTAELERLLAEIVPPEPAVPPIMTAELPPAPPRETPGEPPYDAGIGPLPPDRLTVIVMVCATAFALAVAVACWLILQDSPAVRDVGRHIDEETAELPREPLNADEHRKALLRSVRPDLVPTEAPSASPPADADRANAAATDVPAGPEEGAVTKKTEEVAPTSAPERMPEKTASLPEADSDDKAPGSSIKPVEKPAASRPESRKTGVREERPDERPSVRAIRQAGIRHNFRRAKASMDRTASGSAGQLVLPDALRPTRPPG